MGNYETCVCPQSCQPTTSDPLFTRSNRSVVITTQHLTTDNQDIMDQCDNPSRQLLSRKFLNTEVIASNNILAAQSIILRLNSNKIEGIRPQISFIRMESTEMSIGKRLPEEEEEQLAPQVQAAADDWSERVRPRKSSLQSRVPIADNSIQQGEDIESNTQDVGDMETASTIMRQISGYILSSKNMFEPIRISKECFVKFRNQNVALYYSFGQKLGEGTFGSVYRAINRQNGQQRAIKVLKRGLITRQQQQKVMGQIDILKKLDHPNILKIYQAYTFQDNSYIVTEYCQGGSLLKNLKQGRKFSLASIKSIMKKLLSALIYLHRLNIVHRDIKLQNIVLVNKTQSKSQIDSLDIRIIDFGLAKILTTRRVKDRQKVGTYTHMAPEVLQGIYSTKCDIWSSGIVLFCLISGSTPFRGKTRQLTFDNIRKQQLSFSGTIWRNASFQIKDFIVKLLNKRPGNRISAEQAVNHPWMKGKEDVGDCKQVFQRMTRKIYDYYRGNNLISVIESYLTFATTSQQDIQEFAKMFELIDQNCDGYIQKKELQIAFQKSGLPFSRNQIDYVLGKIDKNHSGKIDYSQFVTILSDRTKLFARKSLLQAFEYLDSNRSGYLQKCQLRQALKLCDWNQLTVILSDLDENQDDKISKDQFLKYLETSKYL